MREIKFRLIKDNKIVGYEQWFEGNEYFIPGWEYALYLSGLWIHERDGGWIEHQKKDQFIDLYDRNGKEIWEGDKISLWSYVNIVEWKDGAFGYTDDSGNFHSFADHYWLTKPKMIEVEVIGNIYENPTLLGGDHENS